MKLYKYLSVNETICESIFNGLIKFSIPSELNDRFEGMWARISNDFSKSDLEEAIRLLKGKSHFDQKQMATGMLIALASEFPAGNMGPKDFLGLWTGSLEEKIIYKEAYKKDIIASINDKMNEYCILSLTSDSASQLMWTHYAANEKGILLEFDSNHPYFKNNYRKVKYSKKRKTLSNVLNDYQRYSDFTNDTELRSWILSSLLIKSRSWQYEKEYRVIKKINEADCKKDNNIFLFNIPFEAWTGVYYGPELDDRLEYQLQSNFIKKREKSHIRRFKVLKSDSRFGYEYVER